MGEDKITVGEVSEGEAAGASVELPVVDVLTGRAFITGKSGSGKSNTASVICEKLLAEGYGILIVDIDGEYYGLKEEYEILHVGADDGCDLRVNVEHAEKIAELALEGNVPIILDVSSFLDESEARELLTEVTRQLFAKEKKLKQPFLMLVEEVHEYIPEGGGVDECGRMLIKVGKRGRKHGLGIVGISQRPADVKKDFITQCDWLVWHRLTWNNDTKVVGRILGDEYESEIEDVDDGECFLMTDWAERVHRVQFERKRTFDAGATPGLDDFERPELKSVSGDLVDELQEITDEQERRRDRIAELQHELEQREERIRDLERQLSDARDLQRMADRFSRAMMEQVTGRPLSVSGGQDGDLTVHRDPALEADLEAVRRGDREPQSGRVPDASESRGVTEAGGSSAESSEVGTADATTGTDGDLLDSIWGLTDGASAANDTAPVESPSGTTSARRDGDGQDAVADPAPGTPGSASAGESRSPGANTALEQGDDEDASLVARLRSEVASLEDLEREMLRHYRQYGPVTPRAAHDAAGGSGDRTDAYAANRALRKRGLVEHVGRGRHDYAIPALVAEEATDPLAPDRAPDPSDRDRIVEAVEATFVDDVEQERPTSPAGGSREAAPQSDD